MQCPYLRRSERLGSTAVHHRLKAAAFLHKAAIGAAAAKARLVRIADIDVHCSEGPLCSLSFEFERYSPQAYHVDGRAFLGLERKVIILMTGVVNRSTNCICTIPVSVVLLGEGHIHPVMLIAGHVLIEDSTASLLRTTCC